MWRQEYENEHNEKGKHDESYYWNHVCGYHRIGGGEQSPQDDGRHPSRATHSRYVGSDNYEVLETSYQTLAAKTLSATEDHRGLSDLRS